MSKQVDSPFKLAREAVRGIGMKDDGEPRGISKERFHAELAVFNSTLIVQAINRLTDAVKANTKAIYMAASDVPIGMSNPADEDFK